MRPVDISKRDIQGGLYDTRVPLVNGIQSFSLNRVIPSIDRSVDRRKNRKNLPPVVAPLSH